MNQMGTKLICDECQALVIVTKAGADGATRLAGYKVPRRIHVVAGLPVTRPAKWSGGTS